MGGTARQLFYVHDPNGNRTRIEPPDEVYFSFWHDPLGRPFYLFHSGWSGIASAHHAPHGALAQIPGTWRN